MSSPDSSHHRTASIFLIPCPKCGNELKPVAESGYVCPDCATTYRATLGYLVPTEAA